MTISKHFWQFLIFSVLSMGVGYFLHARYLDYIFENLMVTSYVVNMILATLVFLVIEKLKKTHTNILGYIFLAGSSLKFLVYFIYIYPLILESGEFTKQKFFMFFIPYGICLVIEVIFLVRLLGDDS